MSSLLPQSFPRRADLWWLILACGVGGWLVIRSCWWEWSFSPQYSYGTLVPLLVLLLLARRWPDRPEQQAPSRSGRVVAVLALAGSALLLALIQPVVISNADWRLVPLVAALCGVTLAISSIYLLGGAGWMKHFSFSVLFFLVAVPWPGVLENALMSLLMAHNAAFCVEVLHWMGYAAEQRGNLIAIPGAILGVEEACSGIRSLQSGIMVSLAMGEFFRLKVGGRIFLFLLSLGAAMVGNALRSLTLSVAACQKGAGAVDQIHDAAGISVLLGTSVVVLVAAKVLAGPAAEISPQRNQNMADSALPRGLQFAAIALVLLWLASATGAEAWFRWHESKAPLPPALWTLSLPLPTENIETAPISERTLENLVFPTTARSERWRDNNGWQWETFYFRWVPGPSSANSSIITHDPRICLPSVGLEFAAKLPDWTARVGRFHLNFQRYLFQDRGRPLQVFHTVVEDNGASRATDESGLSPAKRWKIVWQGRRNTGLRVLEFAVQGAPNSAEAEAAAQEWLSRRIEMQTGDE